MFAIKNNNGEFLASNHSSWSKMEFPFKGICFCTTEELASTILFSYLKRFPYESGINVVEVHCDFTLEISPSSILTSDIKRRIQISQDYDEEISNFLYRKESQYYEGFFVFEYEQYTLSNKRKELKDFCRKNEIKNYRIISKYSHGSKKNYIYLVVKDNSTMIKLMLDNNVPYHDIEEIKRV